MSDELAERLAKNLKQLRASRGMTQQQIAKLCGLPRATWANLESSDANPTLSVLEGIAKFFDDHRPAGTAPITVQSLVAQDDPEDELLRQRRADHQVRAIAMRAGDKTPAMRKQLLKMIAIFDQVSTPDPGTGA